MADYELAMVPIVGGLVSLLFGILTGSWTVAQGVVQMEWSLSDKRGDANLRQPKYLTTYLLARHHMSDDTVGEEGDKSNRSGDGERIGWGRLPFNQYIDVLADSRCRHTLYYLHTHQSESMRIETVARHVTAFEVDYSPDTLVKTDYADIQRELDSDQLPRLAAAGIIDFDHRNGVVQWQCSSWLLRVALWISKFIERPA